MGKAKTKKKSTRTKSGKRTPRSGKNAKESGARRPRGLWKGSISFGLVNIPVYLESAKQEERLRFRLIDKRDQSPVGYKQINKVTGKEISRNVIVKGFEFKKDEYVLMSDADFQKANVDATRTIDIEDFVDLEEVDPLFFERPYYILPQKGGEKGYVLIREALKKSKKAAISKIVLHTVQHLAAIMARGDYLILEILRFANEIKEIHEADFLEKAIQNAKVSQREIEIAEQLVEGMSGKWRPEKYRDTYREDLMKLINSKVRRGATTELAEAPTSSTASESANGNVVDLVALLKKSLNATKAARKSHGA